MIFRLIKSHMKIILDCDLMRFPNSGLYHYCLNLGTYVSRILKPGDSIAFYVPPAERNSFGQTAEHIVEKKGLRNFFKPFLRHCSIWHAPFQSGRIVPDRRKNPHLRVLLTIHDLNPVHEGKTLAEQKQSLAVTQSLIDRSDAIVCISEFCRRDVLFHCDVKRKPVYVIHNGTHQVLDPQMGLDSYKPSRPFLFGMGYINTKKNYHVLLPLLKNEQIEMVIAGRLDEPDYIEKMKKQATALGVADRLHLPGPVSEGEKSWYLRNCLAFVHPSLAEGFGAPVVEAMQFGKPLFLSALTSLPEIAGDTGYYFQSFDSEHVCDIFGKGMEDFRKNGMSDRIIKKGQDYNWEQKAQEYLKVYTSLAAN
jgi:glycosyltransferase involved in cell wall biosynthesis